MDLTVSKAQGQREPVSPQATNQPAAPLAARDAFAAMLDKLSVRFNSDRALPIQAHELANRAEKPEKVEQPERPAAPRADKTRTDSRNDSRRAARADDRAKAPAAQDAPRPQPTRDADADATKPAAAPTDATTAGNDAGAVDPANAGAAEAQTQTLATDADLPAETNAAAAQGDANLIAEALPTQGPVVQAAQAQTAQVEVKDGAETDADALAGKAADDTLPVAQIDQDDDNDLEMTMVGGEEDAEDIAAGPSPFKSQLAQQAEAAKAREAAAAAANARAAAASEAKRDAAGEQAQDLGDRLGSDTPLQMTVTTATDAKPLPQTNAGLVPAAALAAEAMDDAAANVGTGLAAGAQNAQQSAGPANAGAQDVAQVGGVSAVNPQDAAAAQGAGSGTTDAAARAALGAEAATRTQQTSASAAQTAETPTVSAAQAPAQASDAGRTQATRQPPPARPVMPPSQVVEQVKVNISRAVSEGMDNINIQLRPDNLGRIEVKLEVQSNGQVHAKVTADNPETLAMLKQDARGLEQALKDAGLRTDQNNLSFNLRGEQNGQQQAQAGDGNGNGQGAGRGGNGAGGGNGNGNDSNGADDRQTLMQMRSMRAAARGGVDVRI